MKVLHIALVLSLAATAGCAQTGNQSVPSSPYAGSEAHPWIVGRVQPNPCAVPWVGGPNFGANLFVRWPSCGGLQGRMYFGNGTTPGIRLVSTDYATNPGGVPVPPGETPVLFEQMDIDAPAGLVTFTQPSPVPPYSRIQGVANGQTYQLYAYINGVLVTPGFPIILGTPVAGFLRFTTAPYSPLPLLPASPAGTVVSFELVTP